MDSGKAVILGCMIKGSATFRASEVTESTGLSRQLVYYHLRNFIEEGFLRKVGRVYTIVNKDDLINALVTTADGGKVLLPEKQVRFLASTEQLNATFKFIAVAKAAKMPFADAAASGTVEQIDAAIAALKGYKKYIHNKQFALSTQHRVIEETDITGYEFLELDRRFTNAITLDDVSFRLAWQERFAALERERFVSDDSA